MNNLESSLLVEAVLLWTGYGRSMMPCRDEGRLIKRFGSELAAKLLLVIGSLEEDFYSSDAKDFAPNLQEMGNMAEEQFKKKHPEVADEIVQAFSWCYTFDYR